MAAEAPTTPSYGVAITSLKFVGPNPTTGPHVITPAAPPIL